MPLVAWGGRLEDLIEYHGRGHTVCLRLGDVRVALEEQYAYAWFRVEAYFVRDGSSEGWSSFELGLVPFTYPFFSMCSCVAKARLGYRVEEYKYYDIARPHLSYRTYGYELLGMWWFFINMRMLFTIWGWDNNMHLGIRSDVELSYRRSATLFRLLPSLLL